MIAHSGHTHLSGRGTPRSPRADRRSWAALCGLVAVLCALPAAPARGADSLAITLPAYQALLDADSTVLCDPGARPLTSLRLVRLYWQPVTGGGFRLVLERDATGMEGQALVLPVPGPGNGYVTTVNAVGESCASNLVTVLPGDVTGVDREERSRDPVLTVLLVDVQGRRAWSGPGSVWEDSKGILGDDLLRRGVVGPRRLASGVYFLKGTTRDRKVVRRRVVVVR